MATRRLFLAGFMMALLVAVSTASSQVQRFVLKDGREFVGEINIRSDPHIQIRLTTGERVMLTTDEIASIETVEADELGEFPGEISGVLELLVFSEPSMWPTVELWISLSSEGLDKAADDAPVILEMMVQHVLNSRETPRTLGVFEDVPSQTRRTRQSWQVLSAGIISDAHLALTGYIRTEYVPETPSTNFSKDELQRVAKSFIRDHATLRLAFSDQTDSVATLAIVADQWPALAEERQVHDNHRLLDSLWRQGPIPHEGIFEYIFASGSITLRTEKIAGAQRRDQEKSLRMHAGVFTSEMDAYREADAPLMPLRSSRLGRSTPDPTPPKSFEPAIYESKYAKYFNEIDVKRLLAADEEYIAAEVGRCRADWDVQLVKLETARLIEVDPEQYRNNIFSGRSTEDAVRKMQADSLLEGNAEKRIRQLSIKLIFLGRRDLLHGYLSDAETRAAKGHSDYEKLKIEYDDLERLANAVNDGARLKDEIAEARIRLSDAFSRRIWNDRLATSIRIELERFR